MLVETLDELAAADARSASATAQRALEPDQYHFVAPLRSDVVRLAGQLVRWA